MAMFSVPLDDTGQRHFIANGRIAADPPLYGRFDNNDEGRSALVAWTLDRFVEAVRAKIPELERLKTMELYYSGFHWADPLANRENAVRNFAFATVETILPAMTNGKPRPEIMLRRAYGNNDDIGEQLNDYAQWLMDRDEYDGARFLNEREKAKYGWCVYLLQTNSEGVCFPVPYPVWDFYKDPSATTDDEMEHYFLARPVPTDWLIENFADEKKRPWLFDDNGACLLRPDNIVSPGYDVLERPYLTAYSSTSTSHFDPQNIVAAVSRFEADPDTGGTTSLVRIDSGERRQSGRTSFLIQMVVRDRTKMWAHYTGDVAQWNEATGSFDHNTSANPYRRREPCCPSGWRVIQLLADGTFLDSAPLDPCFGGRNIEVGRDYHQAGRWYCPGELDNVIPINRSINRRVTQLNRSLEFESVPILLADEGAGTEIDSRAVEPGDVLRKRTGSEIRWLDFRGVATQQFELLAAEKQDLQFISGANESMRGERPVGIEAAAAVRALQQNAASRVIAKETLTFIEHARIIKKMMVATGKKAKAPLWYRANNGQLKTIDPAYLLYEFDVRFAEGTGTVPSRMAQEDKIMNLAAAGMIDQQTALERMGVKGVSQIMQRLQQQLAAQKPEQPQSTAAQIMAAFASLLKADPSGESYDQIQQVLAMAGIKPQPRDAEQQHLAAMKHITAEKDAAPDPAPVIAGNGGAQNRPAGAR